MAEFYRKYEFSQESGSSGQQQWESPDGSIHKIETGSSLAGLKVRKSFFQDSPVFPFNVGDIFEIKKEFGDTAQGSEYVWNTLKVVCKSISIVDEIVMVKGKTPVRLWGVTAEGIVLGSGSESTPTETLRLEDGESQELNGSVEIAIDGTTVVLKRSNTPRTKRSVTAYGTSRTCPVAVGETFDGGVITSTRSSRNDILSNGALLKKLYRYEIEVVI